MGMYRAIQVLLSHLAGDPLSLNPVVAAVITQRFIARAANVLDGEREQFSDGGYRAERPP